jgi:hypothetical protein
MAFITRTLGLLTALSLSGATGISHQSSTWRIESPPALAAFGARIETFDHERMARALSQAGLRPPASVRILLVDDSDPSAPRTPDGIVGQAFGTDSIVIYPRRIGSYPYDSLESVVLHEIAHLALTTRAGGRPLPRWFHEGVAVSIESGWGLGTQVRLLAAAWRDPGIDEVSALFASDELPAATTAYLLSAALIEDVRRRHGAVAPGEIAARVAEGQPFDHAFLNVTGETPDAAAAVAWRVYRGLRWLPLATSPSSVWGAILVLAALAFVVRRRRRFERRRQWEAEEVQEGRPEPEA